MKEGSPEWFNSRARLDNHISFLSKMETLREDFIRMYSPVRLQEMNGDDLLQNVFGTDGMMRLLFFDEKYREFGSIRYSYTSIVYWDLKEKHWKHWKGKKELISEDDAKKYAVFVRNKLLECIEIIRENAPFNSIRDYRKLNDLLSAKCYFYSYPWCLKYFQMIFPQYFPGMYADGTLQRAIGILGLPYDSERLVNAGTVSLFIRRCDINNIVFGNVYAEKWGWEGERLPCEHADENRIIVRTSLEGTPNISYYRATYRNDDSELLRCENEILEEFSSNIEKLNIVGEEKDRLVKTRINQGVFREMLLRSKKKCDLCGVSFGSALLASHIKPWAKSTPEERLDMNNGLLLCPNHDKLFDQGYISFDLEGRIVISEQLDDSNRMFLNVNDTMKLSMNSQVSAYMEYHRTHIFRE